MVTNCQTTNEHIVHALRLFVCRSSHKVSTRSLWSLGRSMLARIIKNNHSPQHLPTSAPADSLRRLRSRYTFLARRSRRSSRNCKVPIPHKSKKKQGQVDGINATLVFFFLRAWGGSLVLTLQ